MSIDAIGQSGLQNAEAALHSVGQNIANAEMPWYSRREIVSEPQQTLVAGTRVLFSGVDVRSVERLSKSWHADQIFQANAGQSLQKARVSVLQPLDTLLSGQSSSLTEVLASFHGSLQQAEAKPESLAIRQQVLGSAHLIANRYNAIDQRIRLTQKQLFSQLEAGVEQANHQSRVIAELNDRIRTARGSSEDVGHLMDKRNEAINELVALTGVIPRYEQDDTLTLALSSGQILVWGDQAYPLSYAPGRPDQLRPRLLLHQGQQQQALPMSDGKLGGLMVVNEQSLIPLINEVGWHATLLSEGVNQHLSPDNDPRSFLFNDLGNNLPAIALESSGAADITAHISDINRTRPAEYLLTFVSQTPSQMNCQITRSGDGELFSEAFVPGQPIQVDGLEISVTGIPENGDRYYLSPWRQTARSIHMIMKSPEHLAFASDPGKPGDNLRLQALVSWLSGFEPGSYDLAELYTRLQNQYAHQSAEAEALLSTAESVYKSSLSERDSYSGVNLDEEASNLMRYQQLYQANAALLKVNQTLLEELLSLFR